MNAPKSQKQQLTIILSVITLMALALFAFLQTQNLIWMQLIVGVIVILTLMSLWTLFRWISPTFRQFLQILLLCLGVLGLLYLLQIYLPNLLLSH